MTDFLGFRYAEMGKDGDRGCPGFVFTYKSKYIRPRSIHQYRHRMKVLKEWLQEKGMLKSYIFDFTMDTAQEFMNHLLMVKTKSSRTFNNYLLDYRAFFNTLVRNRYINSNPFKSIDRLPQTETSK